MSTVTPIRLLSTNEFLAQLDEEPSGMTWELIEGEIQERPMTTRGPKHSTALARLSHVLCRWLEEHPDRVGEIATGEARCRIETDPDTMVGIDVAYFEGSQAVETEDGSTFFDGPPVVAVEVLSPSDTHRGVSDRVRRLLAAGVPQVWVADPEFRTVTIHRADVEPEFFAADSVLTATPELPGFESLVRSLFVRDRA